MAAADCRTRKASPVFAALTATAALALAACEPEPPTMPTPAPAPDAPATPVTPPTAPVSGDEPDGAEAIQPGLTWDLLSSGEGVALVLAGPDGARLMNLACLREPASLVLTIDAFSAILSEERLTFGLDDELYVFVAQPTSDRRRGVRATAPVSDAFLTRLSRANTVQAVYGAQSFGPYMPPPPDMARAFAADCAETRV